MGLTRVIDLQQLGPELEKYAFPSDEDDADICVRLGLEQPLETITLKSPQLLVYYYGLSHPRFIMSYDKGMGKTIAYLATLYMAQGFDGKVILVVSENAKLAQIREIERHLERWKLSWVFVEGSAPQRAKAWNQLNTQVYILTYASLLADMGMRAKSSSSRVAPSWVDAPGTFMAFDEWHKVLRNKSSNTFKMLKGFRNERMIFSSGSAGGKGVHSLWPVLHLCNPTKFPAYWPYVMRHSIITKTYFGQKIEGCIDIAKWRKTVASNIFHRRKDLKDYPPKTRQALEVRMEPWQKAAHDQLRDQLFMDLPDGELFASSTKIGALVKLRQFMVCPKFVSPDFGWGAALEGILGDVMDSELSHFVISTPFKGPIPLIRSFFAAHKIQSWVLSGDEKLGALDLKARIAAWTERGGVIIQTIQFAESYELPAAQNMYMLGYLHNHEQNLQAEDRIHRDIRVTPWPVNIYYLKAKYSYDQNIVDALSEESDHIHELMHKPLRELFNVQ